MKLSEKIKTLEEKAAEAQGDAKEELDEAVAKLKKSHQEASEQFAKMKDSTEETWDEAVSGFKSAYGELQKGLEDLKGK